MIRFLAQVYLSSTDKEEASNKYKNMKYITLALFACLFFACGSRITEKSAEAAKRQYVEQQNPVTVMKLEKGPFRKELVNNGRLVALKKCELQFRVGEQLENLYVKNGDKVKAGQVIASLTPFTYEQQLATSKIQVQKARLELQNQLMSRSYSLEDSSKVPAQIMQISKVKSGYADAVEGFRTAEFNLKSTRLSVPFSGIIANLKQKQYDRVGAGSSFCTLIDDSEFEAEFRIVEKESEDVGLGDEVKVIPFSEQTVFVGRISEINPVIDENGLIQVKARVKNPGGLMDGMNVKVMVEKDIPDQLVVPKSAVLLRDNQEVLFRCTKDTVAFWTYIQTTGENTSSYSVIAHPDKGATLNAGDTIIVSGNLNLAHESRVMVK